MLTIICYYAIIQNEIQSFRLNKVYEVFIYIKMCIN